MGLWVCSCLSTWLPSLFRGVRTKWNPTRECNLRNNILLLNNTNSIPSRTKWTNSKSCTVIWTFYWFDRWYFYYTDFGQRLDSVILNTKSLSKYLTFLTLYEHREEHPPPTPPSPPQVLIWLYYKNNSNRNIQDFT